MKTIRYQSLSRMEPREDRPYATTYLKQTAEQRKELVRHISQAVNEIADAIETDPNWLEFVRTPLRQFKTTEGRYRTATDIITDIVNEAKGIKRDRTPKDFAMAPIERWNKLFKGTDYEFTLLQAHNPNPNNFLDLIDDE